MNQQQQKQIEIEQFRRLTQAGDDMDRLARQRREREQREPVRWQQREPARLVNGWRMAA